MTEILTQEKVAIQGYAGAFHEIAARLHYGEEAIEVVPAHTFDELVRKVESGVDATTGLMAIENTLGGTILFNYLLLQKSQLQIIGEVYLRIKQNLLVLPGTNLEDLKEVHSHPMAIEQCRSFFRQYPNIRLVETADTALSAKHLRTRKSEHIGAIASTLAAELYDLDILAPSIETNKLNFTRFLVVRHKDRTDIPNDANKVSLYFALAHEVGSLHLVLAALAACRVNLTKIQSAPIPGKPWEYRFFIDFELNGTLELQHILEHIQPLTSELHVLGAYRKGAHFEY